MSTEDFELMMPQHRELIRKVCLRNGYTVRKGQTDLKEYVFQAAFELMRLARKTYLTDDPTEPGWYIVISADGDGPKVRAWGRDGRWWTPLGRGNGLDGWISSPSGYRWLGPIADIDDDQPFLGQGKPT